MWNVLGVFSPVGTLERAVHIASTRQGMVHSACSSTQKGLRRCRPFLMGRAGALEKIASLLKLTTNCAHPCNRNLWVAVVAVVATAGMVDGSTR